MHHYPQTRVPTLILLLFVLAASSNDPWGQYFSQVAGWTWVTGTFLVFFVCAIAACSFRYAWMTRIDAEMITGTQWSDEMFRKMHKTHMYEDPMEQGDAFGRGSVWGGRPTKMLGLDSTVSALANAAEEARKSQLVLKTIGGKSGDIVIMSNMQQQDWRSVGNAEDEKRFETRGNDNMGSAITLENVDSGNSNVDQKRFQKEETASLSLGNIRTESESQRNLEKIRNAILQEKNKMHPTIPESPESYLDDGEGTESQPTVSRKIHIGYLNLEEKITDWASLREASRALAEASDDMTPERGLREVSTIK